MVVKCYWSELLSYGLTIPPLSNWIPPVAWPNFWFDQPKFKTRSTTTSFSYILVLAFGLKPCRLPITTYVCNYNSQSFEYKVRLHNSSSGRHSWIDSSCQALNIRWVWGRRKHKFFPVFLLITILIARLILQSVTVQFKCNGCLAVASKNIHLQSPEMRECIMILSVYPRNRSEIR